MENVTDKEFDALVKGLKKMEYNHFSIYRFVIINKEVIRR
jgi:hypothetical protein